MRLFSVAIASPLGSSSCQAYIDRSQALADTIIFSKRDFYHLVCVILLVSFAFVALFVQRIVFHLLIMSSSYG